MGREKRSGFGYGMSVNEAQYFFINVNQTYGAESYRGGGNDITQWTLVDCVEKPVDETAAKKTKAVRPAAGTGKLMNGFRITNETPEFLRLQIMAQFNNERVTDAINELTLSVSDARKMADVMAKKHNCKAHVLPVRLWQDEQTKRLSLPMPALEVTPTGGTPAKAGTWSFEVEVKV